MYSVRYIILILNMVSNVQIHMFFFFLQITELKMSSPHTVKQYLSLRLREGNFLVTTLVQLIVFTGIGNMQLHHHSSSSWITMDQLLKLILQFLEYPSVPEKKITAWI